MSNTSARGVQERGRLDDAVLDQPDRSRRLDDEHTRRVAGRRGDVERAVEGLAGSRVLDELLRGGGGREQGQHRAGCECRGQGPYACTRSFSEEIGCPEQKHKGKACSGRWMLKRTLTFAALCRGAPCCAWVAAPALSLQPYVPEAVDFEQCAARPRPGSSGRSRTGNGPRRRALDLARGVRAGGVRPGRHRGGDARGRDPGTRDRRRVDRVGRDRRRRPVYVGRRRGGAGAGAVPARGGPPLRERLRHGRRLRRADCSTASAARSTPPSSRSPPPRSPRRSRRSRGSSARANGAPTGRGRLRARRDRPSYGEVRAGGHPPHRQRQRLHGGRGSGDRARDLPLPRQRQRLERHRLPRARRPLRPPLRGPRRAA